MYQSPYSYPNPFQTMPQPSPMTPQQVVKVNGRNGAEAFRMSANSSALLLDESAPMVWLATTDGAGYKSLTAYDISPHKDVPVPDMKSLEERITKIEEALRNGNESYYTGNSRKIFDEPSSPDDTGSKSLK